MRFIRFVSIEEIETLLKDGKVLPIKPRRDCLYFFPLDNDGGSIPYRLQYLSGVVEEYDAHIEDRKTLWFFVCLNLELDETKLKRECRSYADPEGSWFDTIGVEEYHGKDGYRIEDVKSVDIWGYDDPFGWAKLIKHFDDVGEARTFVKDLTEIKNN